MPRNHKKRPRKPWLKYTRANPDGSVTFGLGMRGNFNIRNWPGGPPPALGTVRTWLRKLEDNGHVERAGVRRTGKPGRPPVLWAPTEAGRQHCGRGKP
jgi:hypothetical protein